MISPKITNLGYSSLWTDMSTILGYTSNFDQQIQKLFSNGEQGFAYDPNDLSTMFQDEAGTVPVTGAGQPVGLIRDKSGRNNHAFQSTSASRPILRKNAVTGANYLEFDGVDDFLQVTDIALPNAFTAMFAVDRTNTNTSGILMSSGLTGYLYLSADSTLVHSSSSSGVVRKVPQDVITYTLRGGTSEYNIKTGAASGSIVRENTFSTIGTKYIGRFSPTGSAKFDGNMYGIVVITKDLSTAEESTLRQFFNKRLGV